MTEAISLALIALVGILLFAITAIVLVKIILKTNPSHIKLWTNYGWLDVGYDTKADK